jgi:hydrogenase maturation protein HypF
MTQRLYLTVRGVVQGVGFRPFVYGLATRCELAGHVGNDGDGVFIEIEGADATLSAFQVALTAEAPPLSHIESVTVTAIASCGDSGFVILDSQAGQAVRAHIPPDVAICADCLRELFDPQDRRYGYPFINCTHCGPRFTIIRGIPYDRATTTMAEFSMCAACAAEYHDPRSRRFHAQPIACPECGPKVWFEKVDALTPNPSPERGVPLGEGLPDGQDNKSGGGVGTRHASSVKNVDPSHSPITAARDALRAGQIVAIKGLGGFHLACDSTNDDALATLRERKGRVDKPFAIMVRDLDMARELAHINDDEAALLTSRHAPIVLLRKREPHPPAPSPKASGSKGVRLSEWVAPGNPSVGIMLPYTPLHHLLLDDTPLVMTSGNLSGEPIAIDNDEARARLSPLVDAFLMHDRPIHTPCDDSVLRVVDGHELPIRRSRGYTPYALRLPVTGETLLATGGELKNTFCLAHEGYAYLSQHIGDMENIETLAAFERAHAHLCTLYRAQPRAIVCDLHPDYLTTRWAQAYAERTGVPLLRVQHHHAHIAAVMAEHGLEGTQRVIGICLDGTGYGANGTIWGGEVLIADYASFERAAYLKPVPLPGGDAAIKHPYRMALAHLWAAGIAWDDDLPPVQAASLAERRVLARQFETGFQTVPTSSMGRLFDAVAALLGVRQSVTYEAQAANELEGLVEEGEGRDGEADEVDEADDDTADEACLVPTKPASLVGTRHASSVLFSDASSAFLIDPAPLLHAIIADMRAGVARGVIAARFHVSVADALLAVCLRLRDAGYGSIVALSGGVMQNEYLMSKLTARLRAHGFDVLTHRLVPPNDGGLALGQAVIGLRRFAKGL